MCGICGVVSYSLKGNFEKSTKTMMEYIHHRGPDASGIYQRDGVALGHTRLSIIDIAHGSQPIHNDSDTVHLIFNGEIFNYKRLRESLKDIGHSFHTKSDTEVILRAFEEYGIDCVEHLDGEFAFAIWDDSTNKLFVARDRLGIKPFFYSSTNDTFFFSSELKSLIQVVDTNKEINIASLNRFLSIGYLWGPESIFQNINKLNPGHYAIISSEGISTHCYWDIKGITNNKQSHHPSNIDTMQQLLKQSVEDRMVSDVPIGSFLSGGVDSSVLVAVASKSIKEPLNTFSVGFKDSKFDESEYAQKVADQYNTNHHLLMGEDDAVDIFDDVIWHIDEPMADQASIPTYLLSKLTRSHVTVALSGDGSDEIFAGYNKHLILKYQHKWISLLPKFIQRLLLKEVMNRIPFREDFLKRKATIIERYFSLLSHFNPNERKNIFVDVDNFRDVEKEIKDSIPSTVTPLQQVQLFDTCYWLPNDILVKTDRTSMAFGLEARVPFLNHTLVEWALSLPDSLKIRGIIGKYLLKKAYQKMLPLKNVYRKKQGFNYPLEDVFDGNSIHKYFDNSSLYKLLDKKQVLDIIDRRTESKFCQRQFRNLFFLFSWNYIYCDSPHPAPKISNPDTRIHE
ncbi:MAG: asparagine synthase (glutamine-hydrolyzing) [Fibrobacterales bacterium]